MTTKTYIVTSEQGANLRLYPSSGYPTKEAVGHLDYLSELSVIDDWSAVNTVGCVTEYRPVLSGGAVRYVAKQLVEELSYAQRSERAADFVYKRIYELEALHKNAAGVVSLATLEERKRISCNRAASIVLQLAGVLPVGKIIAHTDADGQGGKSKTTPAKAASGLGLLVEGTYTLERADCLFRDLPEHQKRKGTVYIQDSNLCVSAGENRIYSCNQTNQRYGVKGEAVLRECGYPFTRKILYVIRPKD